MIEFAIAMSFVFEMALVCFDNYWHIKEVGGRWMMK